MNDYTSIKEIFAEDNGVFDYINLDRTAAIYNRILNALQKPLKLILLYGKPGTGKTFLLNKIYKDLQKNQKIIFLPQPFFNEDSFINALSMELFNRTMQNPVYEEFIAYYKYSLKTNKPKSKSMPAILLLDEAQLYPDFLIEKIRLMADTRLFKILFTVHKTGKEDVIAKDYFRTRIWENIELENSNLGETRVYIEKKLLFHNFQNYFSGYKIDHLKLIYFLTNGNLRTLNKLLYKVYEIYEYYEEKSPTIISKSKTMKMAIEMAAIDSELINA